MNPPKGPLRNVAWELFEFCQVHRQFGKKPWRTPSGAPVGLDGEELLQTIHGSFRSVAPPPPEPSVDPKPSPLLRRRPKSPRSKESSQAEALRKSAAFHRSRSFPSSRVIKAQDFRPQKD